MLAPPARRRPTLPDVRRHRAYRLLMAWGKRAHLRQGRVSLYDLGERILHELRRDSLEKRAAYMAFNLTLALFPTIIFLFTLIPYIPVPNLDVDILQFLSDIMPHELYAATAGTIEDIVRIPHGGLLSFGFGAALVLSSNGVMALLDAFEKKYPWFKHRGYLHKRAIATVLTFVLALLLVLAIAGIFFGTFIIDWLIFNEILPESASAFMVLTLRYGSLIGLFLLTTCVIFYFVPPVHNKWSFFSGGALVATLLIFLVSFLFTLYVRVFDSYNHFYGSIGALVGFMVWLEFVCMTLIIGFEVNVSLDAVAGRLGGVNEQLSE